jgi:protein-S-isoprenylcysteine O-methyltransferase Ste14
VLPIVLLVLVRTVISREEAYLKDAFGADYGAYTARVRRWL